MIVNFEEMGSVESYHWLVQSVVPRPVAWVLTDNGEDSDDGHRYNLAPFSWFNVVSPSPAVVMISIAPKKDGSDKDTLANLKARKHATLHIPSKEMARAMVDSAVDLPFGKSELAREGAAQLTVKDGFELPVLEGSKIAFDCTLLDIHQVPGSKVTVAFLKLEKLFADESVMVTDAKGRDKIDATAVQPVTRLGGDEVSYLTEIESLPRPQQ